MIIAGAWFPTAHLRISRRTGGIEQRWDRETSEWRTYGGKEMLCKGVDHEWRTIPMEELPSAETQEVPHE